MKKTNLALIVFALIFSACTNEINKNPVFSFEPIKSIFQKNQKFQAINSW